MTTIVGLSGSLRQASFNSALLRAAVALMPPTSAPITSPATPPAAIFATPAPPLVAGAVR